MEAALQALLTQTVSHARLTGRDGYGNPTYGAAAEVKARVTATHRRVRDQAGSEVLARHVAYLDLATAIGPQDRLTLPDGTTPPILQVDQYTDDSGAVHHTKVLLG